MIGALAPAPAPAVSLPSPPLLWRAPTNAEPLSAFPIRVDLCWDAARPQMSKRCHDLCMGSCVREAEERTGILSCHGGGVLGGWLSSLGHLRPVGPGCPLSRAPFPKGVTRCLCFHSSLIRVASRRRDLTAEVVPLPGEGPVTLSA